MSCQRLSRQFERTVAQLRELQKNRHTREKQDVNDLLDIIEMYESKGETYLPSDDGFVFSQTRINAAIRTRNRERLWLANPNNRGSTSGTVSYGPK